MKIRTTPTGINNTQNSANNPNGYSTSNNNNHQSSAALNDINFGVIKDWLNDKNILDRLINAPFTDTGNAECFLLLHQKSLRYCKTRKQWLHWSGCKWDVAKDGEAQRAAIKTVRARKAAALHIINDTQKANLQSWVKQSESVARRNAILNTAIHLRPIETDISLFDQNPFLAGVQNGTLDLEKGEIRNSNRDDYLSMQLNTEYHSSAKAPRWEQFLDEIFNGDKELIVYIQRAVGYSLTGDTSEQVFFMCHGNGANGKSVFLDTITELLGDYATNSPFSTFEATKRNDASNDLARLKGKRFVSVIETNEDKRLDEARVKSVTGQDLITARHLFANFFSFMPSFKIWMSVNHMPLIRGTDSAIWRRIRLIPFTQNFQNNADPYLAQKLKEELPGILNWAIEGLKGWHLNRLGTAKAIEAASQNYKKESDLLQQWLDEETTKDENDSISCSAAHITFKEWCKRSGFPEWSKNTFGRAMTEKGYLRKRDSKGWSYVGLVLLTPLTP